MADRATEKKAWEVEQGAVVANELNRAEGTDYKAEAGTSEPADVVLTSSNPNFPNRSAQVVSIPLNFRHRDDKQTVQRLQATLVELLMQRGMRHMLVGLILSGKAELHGMKPGVVDQLADIIVSEGASKDVNIRYDAIYERLPELAELVHDIFVSHHPDVIEEVSVDIPAGGAFPMDGRWIQEGIQKKVDKYGGEKAVNDLMLIIGVAGFVNDEQVTAFQKTFAETNLPFAEIWINTPFHGTICLKRRERSV